MLQPPSYMWGFKIEKYLYQDKVLQPRVWPAQALNGSSGMTKCVLVKAAHFQEGCCYILEWNARHGQISFHKMYSSISFRKSTPPQNRQLIVYYD